MSAARDGHAIDEDRPRVPRAAAIDVVAHGDVDAEVIGGPILIYFEPGMWIEEGMRYTDGIRRYIAIRSGQAESLTDEYYFEAL